MIIKRGNILSANTDIICQQVNCRAVMGAGLAKEIRAHFPGVYDGYIRFCAGKTPQELLGKVNFVSENVEGKTYVFANIFGQLDYGRGGRQYTDYAALESGFREVHAYAKEKNLSVAIPYGIGCGLGGGCWERVKEVINKIFNDEVVCEIWML
jgi:O-acetyl-ADP-ribose deacetylase (regulator of RNase III)